MPSDTETLIRGVWCFQRSHLITWCIDPYFNWLLSERGGNDNCLK